MKTYRGLTALFAAAVCAATTSAEDKPARENDAIKPMERSDTAAKQLHEAHVERAKKGNVDVLFLGDSITQGWSEAGKKAWDAKFGGWNAANFGGGGDRTQHVLWRIGEGKELAGIEPKVIVLLVGTNNNESNTADETAAGVKAVVDALKKAKPKAKVLLLGLFPRAGKPEGDLKEPTVAAADELHPNPKAVNDKLARLGGGNVKYLDIGGKLLDANGGLPKAMASDFLHPTEAGYAALADALAGPIEELLKK